MAAPPHGTEAAAPAAGSFQRDEQSPRARSGLVANRGMIGPSERGIELVTCFAHGRFVLGVEERRKMVSDPPAGVSDQAERPAGFACGPGELVGFEDHSRDDAD